MNPVYLGIDGGQSSTTALVGDASGRVIGYGRGGPCNHVEGPEGREKFLAAVRTSLEQACRMAGVEPLFRACCGGFSGGAADKETLFVEAVQAEKYLVTHDALIALAGATAGEPGIIVVAGTGSIAFGRNAAGKTARAGGWGYVFGDEGGGFDLTRQALRAALRWEEGWGPATALHGALLKATGTASANELLHRFYTVAYSRPQIASYAQLVDEVASHGDPIAREILGHAAQQLAALAGAVRRQLFAEGERIPVAYIGGVWRSGLLRERFRQLVELEPGNVVSAPAYGPAAGALIEAYRADNREVTLKDVPEFVK
ncbi:MAG: ATPase [Bryobacteraceae bacterium]|nr:ATPase [Bryobacteraceae bacterium]MDW8380432.1 BadF/BadG/BcrA/BcrD ATPase family protein [Bryobacterales bacterium]